MRRTKQEFQEVLGAQPRAATGVCEPRPPGHQPLTTCCTPCPATAGKLCKTCTPGSAWRILLLPPSTWLVKNRCPGNWWGAGVQDERLGFNRRLATNWDDRDNRWARGISRGCRKRVSVGWGFWGGCGRLQVIG